MPLPSSSQSFHEFYFLLNKWKKTACESISVVLISIQIPKSGDHKSIFVRTFSNLTPVPIHIENRLSKVKLSQKLLYIPFFVWNYFDLIFFHFTASFLLFYHSFNDSFNPSKFLFINLVVYPMILVRQIQARRSLHLNPF